MIDASAVARVLGVTATFKQLGFGQVLRLPQRIAVFAQGASAKTYSLTKATLTNSGQTGETYGYGCPIDLMMEELKPSDGRPGVGSIPIDIYPLEDAYEGVAAQGSITPSGTASKATGYRVRIGGRLGTKFVIPAGAIVVATVVDQLVASANSVLRMPFLGEDGDTVANFVAKWAGESGNGIPIEVIADESVGVSFAIVQPTGGLVNPDLTTALAQMGNVWETLGLNALNIDDTDTLDVLQNFGEGRWDKLVRKPMVFFTGNTEADQPTAVTVPSGRKTDRINAQLVAPGSVNPPFVVAARQLAAIAVVANNNPPTGYGAEPITGIIPGTDGEQWDYTARDVAVKAGSSTVEVVDGQIQIGDVVTFYHPDAEPIPAYAQVVDIVKLQNVIFNLDVTFGAKEWAAAPLIPDFQPTVNPKARKPKDAKAAAADIVDNLALEAILSDPDTTKKAIEASIDSSNPKRLNLTVPVSLSGNTIVKDVQLEFGFFFGSQAAA